MQLSEMHGPAGRVKSGFLSIFYPEDFLKILEELTGILKNSYSENSCKIHRKTLAMLFLS